MVNFDKGVETVNTNDVLYSRNDAIRALAVMMMVNAAESNTDMICDMPEEYVNKDDVEVVFSSLNEQALDMFDDHFEDLRNRVERFLRNAKVTARVRRLDYNVEGRLWDITVDLDVSEVKPAI